MVSISLGHWPDSWEDAYCLKRSTKSEHVEIFSRGIDASSSTQSIWPEKTQQQYIFLSLSVSALEMFFPIKLSHLQRIVLLRVVTITERTTFDGLKLIWIKTPLQRESGREREGGENKEVSVIYGDKKGRKSVAKERGQPEPVLHARGLLWEKELTGRRSAASSSQTTAAQKEETSWGCSDMSRSFSISLFTCLPLPFHRTDIRQTHVQHTAFSTFTHISMTHTETSRHKKLAGCLCSNKTLKNKPGKADFLMESVVCSASFQWRIIISLMGINYSSSVFWDANDINSTRWVFVLTSKNNFLYLHCCNLVTYEVWVIAFWAISSCKG